MADLMDSARVGITTTNALTGAPLDVDAEVAASSIAVRVGEAVYAVHGGGLTLAQAEVLAGQLTRLVTR